MLDTIPSETSPPAANELRDGRWYSTPRLLGGRPSCPGVGDIGVAPVSDGQLDSLRLDAQPRRSFADTPPCSSSPCCSKKTRLVHRDSQACGWRICFFGLVPLVVMMDRYESSNTAATSMRGADCDVDLVRRANYSGVQCVVGVGVGVSTTDPPSFLLMRLFQLRVGQAGQLSLLCSVCYGVCTI